MLSEGTTIFNTQNLLEETISITDQTMQNNAYSEAFERNRNHLSITHLKTQSRVLHLMNSK